MECLRRDTRTVVIQYSHDRNRRGGGLSRVGCGGSSANPVVGSHMISLQISNPTIIQSKKYILYILYSFCTGNEPGINVFGYLFPVE